MRVKQPSPRALRVYTALLWAYPPAFRRRYAQSMLGDFRDAYRMVGERHRALALAWLWLGALGDIVRSALPERLSQAQSGRWLRWLVAAALGLAIGAIDYSASEVQSTLIVLLPIAFLFGLLNPKHAWRFALVIGLGIPAAHIVGHILNIRPPYKDYVIATLIALIPTLLGVYSGALLRRIVTFRWRRFA